MADEYIRRDFALAGTELYKYGEMEIETVSAEHIQRLPAADVAEAVRCKDCKYFGRELENGKHGCTDFNLPYCRPDDFCSHGVQKEATSTDE